MRRWLDEVKNSQLEWIWLQSVFIWEYPKWVILKRRIRFCCWYDLSYLRIPIQLDRCQNFSIFDKKLWIQTFDMISVNWQEHFLDFDFPISEFITEFDSERKQVALDRLISRIPKVAEALEQILEKQLMSAKNSGYFVGQSPTIADFFSVSFYEIVETFLKPGLLASYKLLHEHRLRIRNLPGVQEFIAAHAHLSDWKNYYFNSLLVLVLFLCYIQFILFHFRSFDCCIAPSNSCALSDKNNYYEDEGMNLPVNFFQLIKSNSKFWQQPLVDTSRLGPDFCINFWPFFYSSPFDQWSTT